MKRKNILFLLSATCLLSIGVVSFSNSALKVNAATDAGEMRFTGIGSGAFTNSAVYLVTGTANQIGSNWTGPFKPVSGQGGVYINDETTPSTQFQLKKANTFDYYFESLNGTIATGTTLKLFGVWSGLEHESYGTEYSFTILDSVVIKTSDGWKVQTYVPDLEPYDTVTLVSASYDDLDRVSFDYFKAPSAWNTYTTSSDNTRNSFAFVFDFEAYGRMTGSLQIRIGTSGAYDSGHYYRLDVNNTWNENVGGVVKFYEYNGASQIKVSPDIPHNLQAGARHTIEFGSIYVKNSDNTFDYVKFDGEYSYSGINTPYNHNRTTKVSLYYPGENIFIGSSLPQKERDTTFSFNRTNENKGIYLNGPVNDIPVDEWKVKGVPASKYNALLNGQPMYQYGTDAMPLAKHSEEAEDNYYIDFDTFGINFSEGDVVTLSDEYHFYYNNKAYTLTLNPISFLFSLGEFTPIENIYDYMFDSLSNRCDPELYSDEDAATIARIVSEAQSTLYLKSNMKELWDLYLDYSDQLDSIDLDEERAAHILGPARENAIAELNAYYDSSLYTEEYQSMIEGYIADATARINTCKSVGGIRQIVVNTKSQIDAVTTKQNVIEAAIMASDDLLNQYLETYDVITTSDLCASGGMTFTSDRNTTYSSGDFRDITSRFAASNGNLDGNLIFQFNYTSTNYTSLKYSAQVSIRVRGTLDNCARFDIGTHYQTHSGVRLVVDNVALEDYDANFVQRGTPYRIECGSIDLDGFDRTLLFIKVDGNTVIKKIVDKVSEVQNPLVIIMDSLTTGSDTATITPIEEGTTKADHAKYVGNLTLDSESASDSLIVNMRKNDIPNGTLLYPLQDGAFTVNGQQTPYYRPEVSLTKMNATQYSVNFDYTTLHNGSVVKLKDAFCTHDSAKAVKKAYYLFEASFIYQNGAWIQAQPSLEDAIRNAKTMLDRYADASNYSETAWASIENIITTYKRQLYNATDVDNVKTLLNAGLDLIDAVPTLLQDYQVEAKALLQAYSELHEYREDDQMELNAILIEAFDDIDHAEYFEDIDQIVENAKKDIDTVKTSEERDLEDLEAEKRVAKTEVEVYTGLLQMHRYSNENIALIRSLAFTARSDIDSATSSEQIESILSTFKEDIKAVKTNDGSVFNGETYIEKGSGSSSGCGGNVVTTSILLSILSLLGLLVILGKKHYLMFNNK